MSDLAGHAATVRPRRAAAIREIARTAGENYGAAILARSLVFVTGKGGAGKTSVSGALALAAAAAGRGPLVCELAARSPIWRRQGASPR